MNVNTSVSARGVGQGFRFQCFTQPATDDEIVCTVARAIRNSQYPPEQKLHLQWAIIRVVRGDMMINAAANVYQLPSSTVHPYVHRARSALGPACPPQAKLMCVGTLPR